MGPIKIEHTAYVGDPYFIDNNHMCVKIPNMLSGNYQVNGTVVYVDEEWGNRVSKIDIRHESVSDIPDTLEEVDFVGVDSASCGFFNEEFKQLMTVLETDDNWEARWQEKAKNIPRIPEDENWIITNQCAIAWAGLGDGNYMVRVGKNADGKVIYIEIDFNPIEEAKQVAEIYGN